MRLPDRLSETAFYWGPLFVGVISLVIGAVMVRTDMNAVLSLSPQPQSKQIAAKVKDKETQQKDRVRSSLRSDKKEPVKKQTKELALSTPDEKQKAGLIETPKKRQFAEKVVKEKSEPQLIKKKPIQPAPFTFDDEISHQGWLAAQGYFTVRERLHPLIIGTYAHSTGTAGHLVACGTAALTLSVKKHHVKQLGFEMDQGWREVYLAGALIHQTAFNFAVKTNGSSFGLNGRHVKQGIYFAQLYTKRIVVKDFGFGFGQFAFYTLDGFSKGTVVAQELGFKSQFWSVGQAIADLGAVKGYKGFEVSLLHSKHIKTGRLSERENQAIEGEATIVTAGIGSSLKAPLDAIEGNRGKENLNTLNCPDRYFREIRLLNANKIGPIRQVMNSIGKPDKALPGRWIFSLSAHKYKKVKRRRCVKYAWSSRLQKRVCIKMRLSRAHTIPYGSLFTKAERKFIQKAHLLIRRRGADPIVRARSPGQWVVQRVAGDLKQYLGQKQHPAICTGAIAMVDYFEKHLGTIKKRIIQIQSLSQESDDFIRQRHLTLKSEIYKILDENGGGIARWSSWQIKTTNLQNALAQVSRPIFGLDAAKSILSKPDFLSALKKVRRLFLREGTELSPATARALQNVYGALEASYYVRRLNTQYQLLYSSLFGSLVSIRDAHGEHCNCEN